MINVVVKDAQPAAYFPLYATLAAYTAAFFDDNSHIVCATHSAVRSVVHTVRRLPHRRQSALISPNYVHRPKWPADGFRTL